MRRCSPSSRWSMRSRPSTWMIMDCTRNFFWNLSSHHHHHRSLSTASSSQNSCWFLGRRRYFSNYNYPSSTSTSMSLRRRRHYTDQDLTRPDTEHSSPYSYIDYHENNNMNSSNHHKNSNKKKERMMTTPFHHGMESTNAYLNKTTLSPWVPTPDVVARRALDILEASPADIHVDLGSGDGRICFHAIDQYCVQHSLGIDIDEAILKVAQDRLARRHPKPTNLEFVQADLLAEPTHSNNNNSSSNKNNNIWHRLVHEIKPTIITMFFASEALELLQPVLERQLAGYSCKIVTIGYDMPGRWESILDDVVLGTQLHLYPWGNVEGSSTFGGLSMKGRSNLILPGKPDSNDNASTTYNNNSVTIREPILPLEEEEEEEEEEPFVDPLTQAYTPPTIRLDQMRIIEAKVYPIRGYNPKCWGATGPGSENDDDEDDEDEEDDNGGEYDENDYLLATVAKNATPCIP